MCLQRGAINEEQAMDFMSGYVYSGHFIIWICERC